ncbi:MAG TPA: TrmH family RNA methyltransferase [Candidatus Binatia bacterium]|nr:TrmH family RNA methyltransferase [Candidatus Binatia bacterium]
MTVVLVRPRNPLNIGAAARAMSNFGAEQLRLVNPYAVAFREARSAVGASAVLKNAHEFNSVADAVADCFLVVGTTAVRNRALQHPLRRLNADSASAIRTAMKTGRVALLFGSEKIGLTNDDFTHCHWLLNVPTHQQHVSMNLGQAVAVCLFGISDGVADEEVGTEDRPAASGEIEKITQGLYEALKISGYLKPGNDAVSEKKIRRLMLRLKLQAMDAKVLLGMVRQLAWKLRQVSED